MRIASLLPAATEIVTSLGAADLLVAVTFECDEQARERCPVVVDTAIPPGLAPAEIDAWVRDRMAQNLPMYELDRTALAALGPDLLLTQDLCRVCALPAGPVEEACRLIGTNAEVLSVDPHTLDDVLRSIEEVGRAAGVPSAGSALTGGLRARLAAGAGAGAGGPPAAAGRPRPRVLVLEWTDPPFLAGHWVPELVSRAGGIPVGGSSGGRSVTIPWDGLPAADLVVVAPCGFGLEAALEQSAAVAERLPGVPLIPLDSARFVGPPGPSRVDGIEALAWAFHPDAVPEPPPGRISLSRS